MMKAIQIVKPGEVTLIDISPPAIKPDEVLVKIHYAGFCGSDLNTYLGKNAMAKVPVIPGHEIGGVIEAIGANVPTIQSDIALGNHPKFGIASEAYSDHSRLGIVSRYVEDINKRPQLPLIPGTPCTINPYTTCGNCSSCRNGRPNACRFNQTLGVQRDGAMCEYIAVPWEKVIADAYISPKDFCFVEPMSVGFHAVDRGEVTARDTVMVIGCGMIGIGATVGATLRGAQVIAVDIDDNKLSIAKQLGAAFTINSLTENVQECLQTITGDFGADIVIEAVGSPATYQMAVNVTAFTGRVVCIGYAKEPIAFETKYFVQKELDIRGSRNATPKDFRTVMEYLKRGTCPIDLLISGIYNPEQVEEAFQCWITEPAQIFRIITEFD